MFGKKCPHCRNKVKEKFEYCPNCGNDLRSKNDEKDYGLLGKNDLIDETNPLKGFGDSFINKLFNNAMKEIPTLMKMIERQMQNPNEFNPARIPSNLNVQFFVNGKRVAPQKRVNSVQEIKKEMRIPVEKIEKLAKLPKKEPSSKIRRLSGKLIYELEVPGVKNIEDIFINKLENSIEVKALSDKNVYSKTINVNLPVIRYGLKKDNLILELAEM